MPGKLPARAGEGRYRFFLRFLFGGEVARVVEVRIAGSMGTLVLVLTFRCPALVRLVVREVLIRIALLLLCLGLGRSLPVGAGPEPAKKVRSAGSGGEYGSGGPAFRDCPCQGLGFARLVGSPGAPGVR